MDKAVGVAAPGGWGLRLREREGLGREGRYLKRDRPTDRVDLHHLEKKVKEKREERKGRNREKERKQKEEVKRHGKRVMREKKRNKIRSSNNSTVVMFLKPNNPRQVQEIKQPTSAV